jgi:hypothetical protein
MRTGKRDKSQKSHILRRILYSDLEQTFFKGKKSTGRSNNLYRDMELLGDFS